MSDASSISSLGAAPSGCGPEIPDAPARGPVVRFTPVEMYPDGKHGYVAKPSGHLGRDAIRRADAFDIMASRASSHGKPNPFTPAQVAMARDYQGLIERHASAGVRCSSLETAVQSSGGGSGEWIDAVLDDKAKIARIHRHIGSGAAMIVRRQRPDACGSKLNITDRRLVDMVCLEGKTMTDVLLSHGWVKRGQAVKVLTQALAGALDRMAGPLSPVRASSCHFGARPVMPR